MKDEDKVEAIIRFVQADAELEANMDAEARSTAHGLIQGYLRPDHKVMNMESFYSALVQALKEARQKGHDYCRGQVIGLG